MADTTTVKAALRTLAEGDAARTRAYRRTVADASDAIADVTAAASFVAAGGVARLRVAIETAERRGDEGAARVGEQALDDIERFRDAAVHFHSARGTVLRDGGQRFDR